MLARRPLPAPGVCLLVILALAGCDDRSVPLLPEPGSLPPAVQGIPLSLLASGLHLEAGARLHLALALGGPGGEGASSPLLQGIQATLRFDPSRLRYQGQVLEAGALVVVNDSGAAQGTLRFLAWGPQALEGTVAAFGFDVVEGGWAPSVALEVEVAGGVEGRAVETRVLSGIAAAPSLASIGMARQVGEPDWLRALGFSAGPQGPEQVVMSQALVGDCRQDRAVNVLDVLDIGNMSVGNLPTPVSPYDFRMCDVNRSGGVNVLDALGIGLFTVGVLSPQSAQTGLAFHPIGLGAGHGCAVDAGEQGVCWGGNLRGQRGNGTFFPQLSPTEVSSFLEMTSVQGGAHHTCGLSHDGRVLCWGGNDRGQLGVGPGPDRPEPAQIQSIESFLGVAVGGDHSCALDNYGVVNRGSGSRAYCWGANDRGQLGVGGTVDHDVPTLVNTQQTFRAIVSGAAHACALTLSGAPYCWGANDRGQLGNGDTADRLLPSPLPGGGPFVALTAGDAHTCALDAAGQLFCWGANESGQLGDGGASDRNVPTLISAGPYVALGAGAAHTCALTNAGGIACWGANDRGQLGDGTTAPHATPAPISAAGRVFAALEAGESFTCALEDDSRQPFCWGANDRGQVGDGTVIDRTLPVPILGTAPAAVVVKALGDGQSGSPGTTLPQPLKVEVKDVNNVPVVGVPVSWTVLQGGGSVNPIDGVTNPSGEAQTFWTLGPGADPQEVQVMVTGIGVVTFTATVVPPPLPLAPGTPSATAGSGEVSLAATEPTGGNPPYSYQWHQSTTGGFTPGAGTALAGLTSLAGTAAGLTNGTTYYFVLVATDALSQTVSYAEVEATPAAAAPPAALVLISGDDQSAAPGSLLPAPVVVEVRDGMGLPVPGETVSFAILGGGGVASVPSAVTGPDGRARVEWTLGPDLGANHLQADLPTVASLTLSAEGTNAAAATLLESGTAVTGWTTTFSWLRRFEGAYKWGKNSGSSGDWEFAVRGATDNLFFSPVGQHDWTPQDTLTMDPTPFLFQYEPARDTVVLAIQPDTVIGDTLGGPAINTILIRTQAQASTGSQVILDLSVQLLTGEVLHAETLVGDDDSLYLALQDPRLANGFKVWGTLAMMGSNPAVPSGAGASPIIQIGVGESVF